MVIGRGTDSSVVKTPPPVEVALTTISDVALRAVFEVMVSKKSTLEPDVNEKSLVTTSSLMRCHSSSTRPVFRP